MIATATIASWMGYERKAKRLLIVVAIIGAAVATLVPAGGSAAATPGCGSFDNQAAAQTYFTDQGGSPGNGVGRLDPDADGVACEGLDGPYQGFATIGYNKKRDFFYGVASMPPLAAHKGEFACLTGNRYTPEDPRLVNIYRVTAAGDVAILGNHPRPAEAKPASGKLIWKADKTRIVRGRYYVAFEGSIRDSPYGPTPCPEFRSRVTRLP
jgi:hypothetical protein